MSKNKSISMVFSVKSNRSDNNEIMNEDVNSKGCVWKGILLSFIATIPFFTHGVETTNLTVSSHSGHYNGVADQVPWSTTALILAAAVSSPIYCYIIDRYGRKVGIFIVSLMQGASCIPFFLATSQASDISAHIIAGVSSAGLFTVLPIYIQEISPEGSREFLLCLLMVMTTAGYTMTMVMEHEELLYLMVALVALQLLLMLVMLESPSYLIRAGKVEMAKLCISSLKCLPESHAQVLVEVQKVQDDIDRAKTRGKITVISIFRDQIWRDSIKIGLMLHLTMVLCGSIIFLDQPKALMQLQMDFDPQSSMVLYCLFAGSCCSVLLVKFIELRYLLTASYAIMVLAIGVLAIYTQTMPVKSMQYVPVAALGCLVVAYGTAWGLPVVVLTELLNVQIRALLIGILYTWGQLVKLAHVHSFPHIENYLGIFTALYLFAGINMFAGVYTLFGVPDLKCKTAKQIEKQLKKVPL